jgi:hypothetical protein
MDMNRQAQPVEGVCQTVYLYIATGGLQVQHLLGPA